MASMHVRCIGGDCEVASAAWAVHAVEKEP